MSIEFQLWSIEYEYRRCIHIYQHMNRTKRLQIAHSVIMVIPMFVRDKLPSAQNQILPEERGSLF